MKNKININISKDTPAETLTELCAVLKTNEKPKRKQPLYALNEDIEKLHARYEELFKQVRNSLNLSAKQIEAECETLTRKYDFELEELSQMRKVDYDIRLAEIEARTAELEPWRGGWWRRLFFFLPLTNRAQDIIEERAGLDADIIHTAAEKKIDEDEKKYFPETEKKLTRREHKRLMREQLKATVAEADNTNTNEVFEEPPVAPPLNAHTSPENAEKPAKQLQGQMTLDELQTQALEQTSPQPNKIARRPRPPKSCRKQ